MPDFVVISLISTGAFIIFATGVWFFVAKEGADKQPGVGGDKQASATPGQRRSMRAGDWFHAAVNLAIGTLLGSAAHGLLQLVVSGAWVMAAIGVTLAVVLYLIVIAVDRLSDRLFTLGVRPPHPALASGKKPLPRVLSLPAGLVVGLLLAVLNLDATLLAMLP